MTWGPDNSVETKTVAAAGDEHRVEIVDMVIDSLPLSISVVAETVMLDITYLWYIPIWEIMWNKPWCAR